VKRRPQQSHRAPAEIPVRLGGSRTYFTMAAMHLSHALRGQGTSIPGDIQKSAGQCPRKSVLILMLASFLKT